MVIAMPLTRRIEAENFIVFGLDYMNYNGLNTGKYLLFLVYLMKNNLKEDKHGTSKGLFYDI